MANTIPVIDQITLEALDSFTTTCAALKVVDKGHSGAFGKKGAQIGDTLRVRKPAQFTVRTGNAWDGGAIEQQYATLALDTPLGVDFSMTSAEMSLDINSMRRDIIDPAMIRLGAEWDRLVLEKAALAAWGSTGTPGTTPTAIATYLDGGAVLTNYTAPRGAGQRHLFVSGQMEAEIIDDLNTTFNPAGTVSGQNRKAEMDGYAYGMNWHVDQAVPTRTNGTYAGTPKVNGASQDGASLVSDGWSSGATSLKRGDKFTIDDVYAVNPVTKQAYGFLQVFTVTADISDTAGAITIPISPSIVGPASSSEQFQNVSALPADNADINLIGATGVTYTQGVLMHKSAVTMALAPQEVPMGVHMASMKVDPESGIGMRFVCWYDGNDNIFKCRFDTLGGILVQRPEFVTVIQSGQ